MFSLHLTSASPLLNACLTYTDFSAGLSFHLVIDFLWPCFQLFLPWLTVACWFFWCFSRPDLSLQSSSGVRLCSPVFSQCCVVSLCSHHVKWVLQIFFWNVGRAEKLAGHAEQLTLHISSRTALFMDALSVSQQVCQRLTEYGVHLHRVHPEKKSQTGILLGVCSKGVLVFEVHNGVRTLVLRFPWRETKKISFSVC